ncbi:SWI/SNF-related matrix-associated actin-dependent regulator of chromatin subfamily A member [Hibiscus syriacus]|uniref:SWI/SNF-related matrix-associated actin-dependent regulator of chromatin subfamily A member n=1 Tax=Hibiscus syriacus TaxID=106335 RepID=A0A6A2XHP9_HIBSY|nr:SWI/SNF-related matrix-associated actin-dependent regulator of chromatin subfamily A member [Hibiscus syriacus]
MIVDGSSPLPLKRRRFTNIDSMEAASAKAKLDAAKEKFRRDIRVFETAGPLPTQNEVPNTEESDDFYEFTAEDYRRVMATKKEDKFLKTRKIREAEEAARRSRITKAVIRVRFPDNQTLKVTFHPSEMIQCLVDLITKAIARLDLPFYLCDEAAAADSAAFLLDDVKSLKGLEVIAGAEQPAPVQSAPETAAGASTVSSPVVQANKPSDKKPAKPKWFKM